MPAGQLWKVDSAERQPSEEHYSAFVEGASTDTSNSSGGCRRAVGLLPGVAHFGFGLFDSNVVRSVSHTERTEIKPMLWPRQTACLEQSIIKRRGRVRRHQTIYRQAWRPRVNHRLRAFGDAGSIAIHAEDKRSYGI